MQSTIEGHALHNLPPTDYTGELEILQADFRLVRERNLHTLAKCMNYHRRIERTVPR